MRHNRVVLRAGLALVGLVAVGGYFVSGSLLRPDSSIVIEFGIDPRAFDGLEVEIDGQVAGRLRTTGRLTRTSFPVREGEHTVRVIHPTYASPPRVVTTGGDLGSAFLVVDFAEMANAAGQPEVVVTFQ